MLVVQPPPRVSQKPLGNWGECPVARKGKAPSGACGGRPDARFSLVGLLSCWRRGMADDTSLIRPCYGLLTFKVDINDVPDEAIIFCVCGSMR